MISDFNIVSLPIVVKISFWPNTRGLQCMLIICLTWPSLSSPGQSHVQTGTPPSWSDFWRPHMSVLITKTRTTSPEIVFEGYDHDSDTVLRQQLGQGPCTEHMWHFHLDRTHIFLIGRWTAWQQIRPVACSSTAAGLNGFLLRSMAVFLILSYIQYVTAQRLTI